MKRFQVLKLFNTKYVSKNPGWKDVEKDKPDCDCIIKVRLINGYEIKAMFFLDKCSWAKRYTGKSSHYWDYETEEPLDNVTHWNEEF